MAGGAAGLIFAGAAFMAGILTGGLFAYLNLSWFSVIVRKILIGHRRRKSLGLLLVLKSIAAYSAVGALIYFKLVNPLAFIIGLTSLVLSMLIVGLQWRSEP